MAKNLLACWRAGFNPWVRKIPWRREWLPTPIFLPGESHGQRSLVGYRFDPWVRKIPWRRKWQPTPVFLPGESHGQRSLVGYSPQVAKSQTRLSDFTFT